jgi:outer membrane protein assembly factor BamE (lipoprotein component of BamABCDE complex)
MKNLLIVLSGVIFLSLFSCSSQKKTLNAYVGKSKEDVIKKMGAPTEITPDKNGEVLWYTTEKSITGATGSINLGSGNQITSTRGSAPHTYTKSIAIYINSSGRVDHWAQFQ